MGPEAVGNVAFTMSFVAVFTIIQDLGLGNSHVKLLSEGKDKSRCVGTYLFLKIVLTIIFTFLVLLSVFLLKVRNPEELSYEQEIMIYLFLVSYIFTGFSLVFSKTFDSELKIAKSTLPYTIEKIIIVTLKIFIALFGLSVIHLATASFIGTLVSFLIFLFLFFYKVKISKPNLPTIKAYFSFGLPLLMISFCDLLLESVDKLMIKAFVGIEEVGFYSAPKTLVGMLTIVGVSIGSLLFPLFSDYNARGKVKKIKDLTTASEAKISLIISPLIIIFIIFAESIVLFILGSNFENSVDYLRVLIFVPVIISLNQPYLSQLMGLGKTYLLGKISIIVVFFNIALNFLMIPDEILGYKMLNLGSNGAIFSSIISLLAMSLMYRYHCYNLTYSFISSKIIFHLFICLLFLIFGFQLSEFVYFSGLDGLFYLILSILIVISAYYSSLVLLGINSKDEFYSIADVINPIKMVNYISNEFREE